MRLCPFCLLPLWLVLSVALLATPALAMEDRFWPLANDMLDFANLDADGNPTKAPGFDMAALGITAGSYGVASISDSEGNLALFGTPNKLFDGDGVLVTELLATTSLTQSAVLMPWPGEPGKYCSVYVKSGVDRKLSQAKLRPADPVGKVEYRNAVIDGSVDSEALAVTATPSRDGYYVVAKTKSSEMDAFQVIKFTQIGVSRLPAAVAATQADWELGQFSSLKFSADGRRLAYGMKKSSDGNAYVALYNFDPITGSITWDRNIQITSDGNGGVVGGVEFSANGRYLYLGTKTDMARVFQVALEDESVTEISPPGLTFIMAGFQLAPNGSIYGVVSEEKKILRIQNPDRAYGPADGCLFSVESFLSAGNPKPGLPVFIPSSVQRFSVELHTGTTPNTLTVDLNSNLLPAGVAAAEFGLCWGRSVNPTPGAFNTMNTAVGVRMDADMRSVLTPETKYHVRAYLLGDDSSLYYGDEIEMTLVSGAVAPGGGGGGGGCFITTCW